MATYIHKNGPESGTIVLKNYELGISDAAYMYTHISGALTPLKVKSADRAENVGGVPIGELFKLTGQDQVVQDTNVKFNDTVTVVNKVVCPTFEGTATKAKYADLAENYESDENYEPGTVLFVGTETEVSKKDVKGKLPNPVVGVVSEKPGYLLNDQPEFDKYVPIALKGRIPVKIKEDAKRGDIIIADRDNPGYARVFNTGKFIPTNLPIDYLGICINPTKDGFCEIKV
jgi:hypothetical protein